MRRIALVLFGLALLLLVSRSVFRALSSEESKIRDLIEEMAAGFNASSANRSVSGLAEDWRDGPSGLEREWLRQGLIQFFLEQRDSARHLPRYRVELPEDALLIELDAADETKARVACVARFLELGPPEALAWEVAIDADLERDPQGWWIVHTEHRTVAGQRIGGS